VEDGVKAGEVRRVGIVFEASVYGVEREGIVERSEGAGSLELLEKFRGDALVGVDVGAGMDDAIADGVGCREGEFSEPGEEHFKGVR
jgi:hypothetical protein